MLLTSFNEVLKGIFILIFCIYSDKHTSVKGIKFRAESFTEITFLAREGKIHLQSLTEKANVPQYGTCWKNVISQLQIGCKFLSENVQSDLAFKFTDCFLQMSGYKPLSCNFPRSFCLKNLPDRAFNAYTEFYTHTHSICYFLQSQLWHEETEKTIDKLSSTSLHVSEQLEEAEKIQTKLLNQQKESLSVQYNLIENSRNVASTLQLSQEKINNIINDFQTSSSTQQQLLIEVLESLLSLKSWVINEMSWFSSTLFFTAATIVGFLFTSVSRTRGARFFIFLIFSLNYFLERYLISKNLADNSSINNTIFLTESLNSWIWLCRKFCIFLSVIVILYIAFNYFDYQVLNYQLLLEIKNQNIKILNSFSFQENKKCLTEVRSPSNDNYLFNYDFKSKVLNENKNNIFKDSQFFINQDKNFKNCLYKNNKFRDFCDTVDHADDQDNHDSFNLLLTDEKLNDSKKVRSSYNLRSSKVFKNP